MTTPAEQEAERRYANAVNVQYHTVKSKDAFVAGAEWSESRYRELLEAAREYREAMTEIVGPYTWIRINEGVEHLLAAAAALEEA